MARPLGLQVFWVPSDTSVFRPTTADSPSLGGGGGDGPLVPVGPLGFSLVSLMNNNNYNTALTKSLLKGEGGGYQILLGWLQVLEV